MVREEIEAVRTADPSTARTRGAPRSPPPRRKSSTRPRTSSSTRTASSLLSRDGWIKRQKDVKDLADDAPARRRRGDGGRSPAARARRRCSSPTTAPPTPAASSTSPPRRATASRCSGCSSSRTASASSPRSASIRAWPARSPRRRPRTPPPVHAVAVTSDGYSLRFSLAPFIEPSTRAGRRYARTADGAEVVGVARTTGHETLITATRQARAMLCRADEVNFLSGPGRGVILIKIDPEEDRVLGLHRLGRRTRPAARRDQPRRRADRQHRQVRGHRTRRAGPRTAPARPVHPGDSCPCRISRPARIGRICQARLSWRNTFDMQIGWALTNLSSL